MLLNGLQVLQKIGKFKNFRDICDEQVAELFKKCYGVCDNYIGFTHCIENWLNPSITVHIPPPWSRMRNNLIKAILRNVWIVLNASRKNTNLITIMRAESPADVTDGSSIYSGLQSMSFQIRVIQQCTQALPEFCTDLQTKASLDDALFALGILLMSRCTNNNSKGVSVRFDDPCLSRHQHPYTSKECNFAEPQDVQHSSKTTQSELVLRQHHCTYWKDSVKKTFWNSWLLIFNRPWLILYSSTFCHWIHSEHST